MKRIISVFSVILILFIIFSFSASAAKFPNATKNFFVNDFANVISKEIDQIEALEREVF